MRFKVAKMLWIMLHIAINQNAVSLNLLQASPSSTPGVHTQAHPFG